MHQVSDITIDELTKVEGTASLEVKIRDNKVEKVRFKIPENKRFFTKAIEGKPVVGLPSLLSRICGTCSNAHIMCSIESCEKALKIEPTEQTIRLRHLTMYGLNIRDHALHLYLFVMPDLFNKDSFLDFDETDEQQNQLLHDAFAIKAAGNYLSTIIAGRAVHATYAAVGGYTHFPTEEEIKSAIEKLNEIRPAVLRLIKVFEECKFNFDRKTNFMALVSEKHFGFLEGKILASNGEEINEADFANHLEHVVHPYSMASAYTHEGESYIVGSLARLNVSKHLLHNETKKSLGELLSRFPSTNIFDNNLAQAIEILHSIDHALELMTEHKIVSEPVIKKVPQAGVGVGVIEAPRGLLFHKVEINDKGLVVKGQIVVPSGQNQISIEQDIHTLVDQLLNKKSELEIKHEIEKLIRAYDPCISCAVHFLKMNWDVK